MPLWVELWVGYFSDFASNPLKDMVGPCGLEPQTSTVSTRGHQVLTTTYKAVGDCQVLDNTPWSATSLGLRVEFSENRWATAPPSPPCSKPNPMREPSAQALRRSVPERVQDGHVEMCEIAFVPSGHGEAVNASRGSHHGILT